MTVMTVGLFSASVPAHYDWLISFADPDLEPATVRANLEAAGISTNFYATYLLSVSVVSAIVWVAVGVVIFWRRPDDWMAIFASLCLIVFGTFTVEDVPMALAERYSALWLPVHLLGFFGSVLMVLFFFLFPDGRFVPRWTRWVPIVWVPHEVAYYFFPNSIFNVDRSLPILDLVIISTFLCIGIGSQLYRYRRVSSMVQRQQTKWVVYCIVLAGLGAIGFASPLYISSTLAQFGSLYALVFTAGIATSLLLIPLSIGVAILRHRLWDIDVIINRTLVYGALTATVVGLYVLLVGGLGALLQARGKLAVSLVATGVIAVLFAPLRDRLQRSVNRLMYGERDEPYAVLSRLGRQLGSTMAPNVALEVVAETIARALKLPYAAVELKREGGFETTAKHGAPAGELTMLPLVHQGEEVGRLVVAPRSPGESFTPSDRGLLDDLAHQAGAAAHAVRLSADLQRSRERLVTAREEERRRLRRDLHDGLGPTFGALTLGLDAARSMFAREPAAVELLTRLKEESQDAVSDVRRLVYGLRPPALDDMGLVAAIRQQAAKHGRLVELDAGGAGGATADHSSGVLFSVEAPEQLPPLPAAVEVACYRIAQEAINNVARHARANSCRIGLSIDDARRELQLKITDDGVGIPEGRLAGVGMSSMRERAEELGGTLVIDTGPDGGTRVLARLPLFGEGGE